MMKLVTFVGSLRKNSFNWGVANYLKERNYSGVDIEFVDIELPYFNEDLEDVKPQAVLEFLQTIESADAFMFITPEYNHGVPGGLKNAIDWASRGAYLDNMPAVVMGASPSPIGAERSQLHLRQILDTKAMRVLPGNDVVIGSAHEKIVDGVLVDENTKGFLDQVMQNFVEWYELVK